MITTKELAERLQDKLNGDFDSATNEYTNITKYFLDRFYPHTRMEFYIRSDEAEIKKASMDINTETVYICGLLTPTPGSSIEGVDKETYNTVIGYTLELLVPNCDDVTTITYTNDKKEVSEEIRLSDQVQLLVEESLSATESEYITAEDGVIYYVGTAYSRTIPGAKMIRNVVGISLPLNVYITHSIVATGISSDNIRLSIKDGENFVRVFTTRLGLARTTAFDSTVSSNAGGVSKGTPNATTLTVSFDAPFRLDVMGKAASQYLLEGGVSPLEVKLEIPSVSPNGEDIQYDDKEYKMMLADVGINGELNLASSMSCRLIEYFEPLLT